MSYVHALNLFFKFLKILSDPDNYFCRYDFNFLNEVWPTNERLAYG